MKCPKCGYLGFEPADRCRNCGYDFSLATFAPDPDLTLRATDVAREIAPDIDVSLVAHSADPRSAPAFDLDRLFGEDPADGSAGSGPAAAFEAPAHELDPSALPFEEEPPLVAPRRARPPLAVRRATPEFPRGRSRATRPVRLEPSLALGLDLPTTSPPPESEPAPISMTASALKARLAAVAIDAALLGTIFAAVLGLTLRIAGLSATAADMRLLPPAPFFGFLLVLSLAYLATFTVAGGQTIGKMAAHIRVIGDDGRSVDATGGVLRAIGSLLVPLTFGLAYLPVFFTSDRRAIHDRVAGTRVVSE